MAVHKAISGCHDLLLLSMRRRLRRADTTARHRAEDTRATPQAAAQIKARTFWTVLPRKLSGRTTGRKA
ncbi:hypothetical protein C2U54_23965 (plasmid) [Leclercia sp. LSNIH1]|nr:hypothetical protein C2U54_23965 [Leclercia sp. LSNIH1]POV31623.1 hypothetical protein C3388_25900 [Leclercia sp. LSNIH5]POW57413.1 hypothetical protein C3389_25795 [Leclercia sp. LSNIH2]